jgi:hypothetical protein
MNDIEEVHININNENNNKIQEKENEQTPGYSWMIYINIIIGYFGIYYIGVLCIYLLNKKEAPKFYNPINNKFYMILIIGLCICVIVYGTFGLIYACLFIETSSSRIMKQVNRDKQKCWNGNHRHCPPNNGLNHCHK